MMNDTDQPVFSVIMPTYNRETILSRTIRSVLSQTFDSYEFLIIDDGSQDNTKKIVQGFTDSRIIYLYKENGGQNSAINEGLKIARGTYVAFIDSDDEWMPEKLQKTYEAFLHDPMTSVVYHQTGLRDSNGEVTLARRDSLQGNIYKEVLLQGYLTSPTFISCKLECFTRVGLLDESFTYCQDDDLCFILAKNFKIALIDDILGIYNTDSENQMMKETAQVVHGWWKLWNKYEHEVLTYCGRKLLRRRFLDCSKSFLRTGNKEMAKKALRKSLHYGISLKGFIIFMKSGKM